MDSSWPIIFGAEIHVGLGPALSFPIDFNSNSKKEVPIGGLGTSIRSVPTPMVEGINTNTSALCL